MKILVVSDTHRKNENYFKVLETENPDMVIHCGDAEGSEYALTQAADCPVHLVLGNNDFFSNLPRELDLTICGYEIWVTHGHNYHVSMGYEIIRSEAQARGKDFVFYGHTHRPVIEDRGGVIVMNPGSLSYPRQEGKKPSYGIVDIQEKGDVVACIKYLRD